MLEGAAWRRDSQRRSPATPSLRHVAAPVAALTTSRSTFQHRGAGGFVPTSGAIPCHPRRRGLHRGGLHFVCSSACCGAGCSRAFPRMPTGHQGTEQTVALTTTALYRRVVKVGLRGCVSPRVLSPVCAGWRWYPRQKFSFSDMLAAAVGCWPNILTP